MIFFGVDSLRGSSSLCPEEHRLHISRREENRSCGKDWEREIDADTSPFQDRRADRRKHRHRRCRHSRDRSPRLEIEAQHHPTGSHNVRRNRQRKPRPATPTLRLRGLGGKKKKNYQSSSSADSYLGSLNLFGVLSGAREMSTRRSGRL